MLRQPLEDKVVTISHARGSLTFPANFQLVAAMNPCPCGYFGDRQKACTCSPQMVTRYQKRISGPLLDRIDIHVEVPRLEVDKLSDDRLGEPSAVIQKRVEIARLLQRQRFDNLKDTEQACDRPLSFTCNADLGAAQVRQTCTLDEAGRTLVCTATTRLQLSARAYHRAEGRPHGRRSGRE